MHYNLLKDCKRWPVDPILQQASYTHTTFPLHKCSLAYSLSISRCVHCSVIFGEAASLKSHIQNTHCELFYKCPMCPMAFKSTQAIHSHGYTQHPGAKLAEPKYVLSNYLKSNKLVVGRRLVIDCIFRCPIGPNDEMRWDIWNTGTIFSHIGLK